MMYDNGKLEPGVEKGVAAPMGVVVCVVHPEQDADAKVAVAEVVAALMAGTKSSSSTNSVTTKAAFMDEKWPWR